MQPTVFDTVLLALLYLLACRMTMRRLNGLVREVVLAFLNIAGVLWFLFLATQAHRPIVQATRFGIYLVLVIFQYGMLRAFAEKKDWRIWLAFFTPIAVLLAVRYVPFSTYLDLMRAIGLTYAGSLNAFALVGISYLAFRSSRLVLEMRNGSVKTPGFWEYLNFCFFLPTMSVGPINTYGIYREGFGTAPVDIPTGRAALRILVGLVKYRFLGGLLSQLSYAGLLLDEHPHHWVDLPVAALFYYLYLYCNFSGFCDIAIGAAGLIGIPVPENFNSPLTARNIKDFWNRWHITLSLYMRDMVFSPLSKFFVRLTGSRYADHAIALAIFVVFVLIGMWHGVGWNYVLFGLSQAVAVVAVHYYTIFLKKKLGRDRFKSYNENRLIRAVAIVITFCYFAASLFLFANTFPEMKEIFSSLR